MRDWKPFDLALIGVLLPLWMVCFALAVRTHAVGDLQNQLIEELHERLTVDRA